MIVIAIKEINNEINFDLDTLEYSTHKEIETLKTMISSLPKEIKTDELLAILNKE